nr:multifunctional transcriptional regulator/nicotinamide-nucleotide adenylyltransferase/ribosylnicotinamide kinase NadR [uncultured Leptotrichia sp.]
MEEKNKKCGIIFGKFYPLHIGHVDFIQKASGYVDTLYVFVCTDDERDLKLFNESKMKKMPTIKDRLKFVEQTFKHQSNIKVLHLAEDGIPFYPNGWKSWSERVQEKLLEKNIKVDMIFTNETQDVENYKNNFLTLPNFEKTFNKNLEIQTIDIQRNNFYISATEVRKNPYKNWFFIPRYVREFFVLKIAIIGSKNSGKTNLTHKLANYFNTTYVEEYRKKYIKEELNGNAKNLQYDDYSKIVYGQNERILKSIKNSDKLVFVDTEFMSLQAFACITEGREHPIIEDFIRNNNFDEIIYVKNPEEKNSEYDNKLVELLEKNKKSYTMIERKKNKHNLTEIYDKAIDILNKCLEN